MTRPRFTYMKANWLLRAFELPIIVGATLLTVGEPSRFFLALVAIASVAWVALLILHPWSVEQTPVSATSLTLLSVVTFTSALASMLTGSGWVDILTVVACLQAATSLRRRAVVPALFGIAGVTAGWLATAGTSWMALTLFALIGGFSVGGIARGLRMAQLREAQAAVAERERVGALAERSRIAREIHDILAHSLADLSIQLEVADALLTEAGDRTGALERVRHAHRLAADGLVETRRAVHALRTDAPPLPDALAVLVGASRQEGGVVTLDVAGPPRALPAAAGLALVRAAQEALVNAGKHAPGTPVEVVLRYDQAQTSLTVRNPVASPGGLEPVGGYGLAGMNERLRLVGGSLTAGVRQGGWTVRAEVPA